MHYSASYTTHLVIVTLTLAEIVNFGLCTTAPIEPLHVNTHSEIRPYNAVVIMEMDFSFLSSIFTRSSAALSTGVYESVTYNPSLLYSTLIIAILLTKGYGRHMALAIGRKLLQEPSRKLWLCVRAIKPRQIVYYGLRWGIPLHQLRELLMLHRNILRKRPKNVQLPSRKTATKKSSLKARSINSTVSLYRKMPLNAVSRLCGKAARLELPASLRQPLLGLYVWNYAINMQEAEDPELKNYTSVSHFFTRKLKPDARLVDAHSPLTSPADGRVLHFGKVENGVVEQVKGVNYSIQGFLGPNPGRDTTTGSHDNSTSPPSTMTDLSYQEQMGIKPGNALYNCIIYLAPGDYHRFHSPADCQFVNRRHFPGELLSVNPSVVRWVQGLFNMNERVIYSGNWKHGYFSYTAVGATNVGSINVYKDPDLKTNQCLVYPDSTFFEKNLGSVSFAKGDMIGEFNFGSTIVVMFEAPENFKFCVEPGQKVRMGQSIGDFQ